MRHYNVWVEGGKVSEVKGKHSYPSDEPEHVVFDRDFTPYLGYAICTDELRAYQLATEFLEGLEEHEEA